MSFCRSVCLPARFAFLAEASHVTAGRRKLPRYPGTVSTGRLCRSALPPTLRASHTNTSRHGRLSHIKPPQLAHSDPRCVTRPLRMSLELADAKVGGELARGKGVHAQ